MMRSLLRFSAPLFFALPLLLSGCALENTASPIEEPGTAIKGMVHGGQQAVVGAHVYLLATNNTGYGSSSSTTASKSVMKFVSGSTSLDISSNPTNGFYYVTTDSNGNFAIGGDYTCTSGQQVYLYVVGGDPGAGANSAAGFLSVLGSCPTAGNFAGTVPFVWVNEVTTIAAAYSMSAFAYDALHVSSPSTTLAKKNILNAFANATNIVNQSTGTANATFNNGNAYGAPNTIDTLANILASCVNTNGPTSNNCATLFTLAKTNGSMGTAPTDTATAAINIAHNQGSNAAALFSLLGTVQAFIPSYTSAPADFAMPILYTSPELYYPLGVAIDGSGNAWVTNTGQTAATTSLTEFSPQGVHLYELTGTELGNDVPAALTINLNGSIAFSAGDDVFSYTPGNSSYTYTTINNGFAADFISYPTGGFSSVISNGQVPYLNGIAGGSSDSGPDGAVRDGSGNVWSSNYFSSTVTKWSSSGARASGATTGYAVGSHPLGIAVDSSNNIWVADSGASTGQLTELNSSGTTINTFTDPNMTQSNSVIVDGSGSIWAFGYGTDTATEFDSQGNILQIFGRVNGIPGASNEAIAFDGAGNFWSVTGGGVYMYVGLGAPVVTPMVNNLVSPYTAPASKP